MSHDYLNTNKKVRDICVERHLYRRLSICLCVVYYANKCSARSGYTLCVSYSVDQISENNSIVKVPVWSALNKTLNNDMSTLF